MTNVVTLTLLILGFSDLRKIFMGGGHICPPACGTLD